MEKENRNFFYFASPLRSVAQLHRVHIEVEENKRLWLTIKGVEMEFTAASIESLSAMDCDENTRLMIMYHFFAYII